MGQFFSAIIEQIFGSLFGAGIDAAGERARGRVVTGILVALAVLLAGWAGVASAFLWQFASHPGFKGLVQYVKSGGPAWLLALPIVSALTIIWLLLPLRGRLSLGLIFTTAVFGLALADLAVYQGGGSSDVGWAGITTAGAGFLIAILGIILVFSDAPPLDAPMARWTWSYWGRYKHLLALREYARGRGWDFSGPKGLRAAFTAKGYFDREHPVKVTSGAKFSVSEAPTYTVNVLMYSPVDILSFAIQYNPPPKNLREAMVGGEVRPQGKKRPMYFSALPVSSNPLPADFLSRFQAVAEAGAPFIGPQDVIRGTPYGLSYTHQSRRKLTEQDAQLDPLVAWMGDVARLLEPVSPPLPPERAAHLLDGF